MGMVLDPSAYIPHIGSTVNINGVPRGVSDSPGIMFTMVHIPLFNPPFLMTPIIGHESINFFSSQNVFADGSRLAPKGYMVMSCNDTGVPLSLTPGRKKAWKVTPTLFAPTSFSLPVPSGPPVNVGGPYIPDWGGMIQNLALRMGFMGVMKGLNKVVNKVLKKAIGPNWLSRALCHTGFEPVNFVNGAVVYDGTDFTLPGPIPFEWKRSWYSDSAYQGMLGHGCHLQYDREMEYYPEDESWGLRMDDGRVVAIPELTIGEPFYLRAEKITITRHYESFEVYHHEEDLLYHFARSNAKYYKLTRIKREAAQIEFTYDGSALAHITDSAGRKIIIETDLKGQITSAAIISSMGQQRKISYAYDEQGNMLSITDALGKSTKMVYEGHLMVKKTDRNGHSFYWEYDQLNRCLRTGGDDGWQAGRIEYYPENGYNRVVDTMGGSTVYCYNEKQLVTRIINPLGPQVGSKTFQYTQYNELYREIDEDGNLTGYDYNEKGFTSKITYPDLTMQHYMYDEDDRLMISVSPGGKQETYTYYEGTKQLRAVIHADRSITQYTYTPQGLPATIKNDDKLLELAYDPHHNLIELNGNGKQVRWYYNFLGDVINVRDGKDNLLSQYEYDKLGRVTRIRDNGSSQSLKYNAYDEVIEIGRYDMDTVLFDYTPLGSLQRRTQGNSRVFFDYDRMERLTKVVNEHNEEYTFTRNTLGRIIAEKGFDGITKQYQHSGAGRITNMKGPGGMNTSYRYNGKGQLNYVDYADGTWETYGYNKEGQLISAYNEQNRIYLERDDYGRIIAEKQDRGMGDVGHSINSEYDKNGLRTKITSTLGADITQNYDALGQLNHIQAAQQDKLWEAHIARNGHGQVTAYNFTGGVESQLAYDHSGRPTNHIVKTGLGRECYKREYTWNSANHLCHSLDQLKNHGVRYSYDALNQLVSASDNPTEYKNPDAVGNLYETLDRTDRKYESGGRLTKDERGYYHYDTLGNLVLKAPFILEGKNPDTRWHPHCWSYKWNANGTLKWVVDPNGSKTDFEYDALGRRTAKITLKTITRYLWDGNVLLHEWSYPTENRPQVQISELGWVSYEKEPTENVITWVYDEGNYTPIAKLINGERYSIVSDYLGRPVQCFDDKGEIVWETDYDIYGRLKNLKGDRRFIPFRQPGQYEDVGLGRLYYNRFRYYDSFSGVYLSQDPIGLAGGMALYGYVGDSNSWVDVFGLSGFFTPSIFNGPSGITYTVYQQKIDWNLPSIGRGGTIETNLDRAMRGDAPFVNKDKYELLNLHHSKQDGKGPLFELSKGTHQKYNNSNALHPHLPKAHPDNPVNRTLFKKDKEAYWMQRAKAAKKAKISCR